VADLFIAYDPSQPVGSRLAPEVREEIAAVAPSAVADGSISTVKLADGAVTTTKLGVGAVASPRIGTNEVKAANLDTGAVSTVKLADGAVTPVKAGTGIVTAVDTSGTPVQQREVTLTAAAYALIATPDPNTRYYITA
jgi:hypothetical protein